MAKEDITTKYKLDISDLKKNITEANKQIKLSNAEFKAAAAGMDDWRKSSDGLTAKLKQLGTNLDLEKSKAKSYEDQMKALQTAYNENGNRVEQLKAKLQELANQGISKTSDEYKKYEKALSSCEQEQLSNKKAMEDLNITIINQQGKVNGIEKDIRNYTNSLNNLGKEEVNVKDSTKELNQGYTILKGTIANLASQAITKAISGFKKLGKYAVNAGVEAVKGYKDYEQLVGGVETLFKKSAGKVEKYANKAYRTAGLSANAYMETVTGFSASLLQGLKGDTSKAAKIANTAIIDMSDNANKMGTAMESIQNAYQGFAKQNYTMLDNLKLGYGGTKSEMARLVKESGILGKAGKDLTAKNLDQKVSFDQIIKAIHKVQKRMGITGTTAKEAEDTIEGSVNSMKSAWQNLLTGIANGKVDNKKLLKNFINSVKTVGKNLFPVVKTTVIGLIDTARDLLNQMLGKRTFNFKGETVVRKIQELFKKLIGTLEWFKKNKNLVTGAIKGILAAFVVSKINNFIQPLNGLVGGFGSLIVNMTKTGSVTKGLWGIFSANPIGTVLTLVGGAITLYQIYKNKTDDVIQAKKRESEVVKQSRESLENYKSSMQEANEVKQDYLNKNLSEIDYYQDLYKELGTIVDKNGKVKKGYEDRAKFIVSTLKDALGIEIEMTKGVIKQNDKLENKIKKVIEQKKAQILIDANKEKYSTAIEKQNELSEKEIKLSAEVNKKHDEKNKAIQDMADYLDISAEKMKEFVNITNSASDKDILNEDALKSYLESIGKARDEVDDWEIEYQLLRKTIADTNYDFGESDKLLNDIRNQYEDNRKTINDYESAMEDMANGHYDAVTKIYEDTHDYMGKTTQETYNNYQAKIDQQVRYIQNLNANKDKYDKAYIKKETAKSASVIKNLAEEQSRYRQKTSDGQAKIKGIWNQGMRDLIQDITGKDIQFKKTADGHIQMYENGIKSGKPMTEKQARSVADGVVKELNKAKKDGKTAGINVIKGVEQGINYQKGTAFSTVSNFGQRLLAKLKSSLKEKSPSKATEEMGINLIKGLNNGVTKVQKTTLKLLATLGSSMLKTVATNALNISTVAKNSISSYDKGVSSAVKTSEKKVKGIIDTYFTNLKQENEKQQSKFQKESEKQEKKLQKQINNTKNKTTKKRLQSQLKTLKEHNKDELKTLKKQNKDINNLYKEFGKTAITQFNNVLESSTNKVTTNLKNKLQTLADNMKKEIDSVNSKISSMQDKLLNYGDLFTKSQDKIGREVFSLNNINKQIKVLQKYNDNITKLKGKISDNLINEIAQMDVDDAIKYSQQLLDMSSRDLKAYNNAYTKKTNLAKKISNDFYADKLKEIKEKYTDKMQQEFENAQKQIENIGKQTLNGFIKGMKSTKYSKEVKSIAQNIIKTMKKELKINSPSKIFEQLGIFSGKGYVGGLSSSLKAVKNSISSVIPNVKNNGVGNTNNISKSTINNFTQNNYSPKPLSRIELYRQSKNLLNYGRL